MLVNKIGSNLQNQNFKGYQHVVNEVGDRVLKFNYPFDYTTQKAHIEFYKVRENEKTLSGYEVIEEPIKRVDLKKEKVSDKEYVVEGVEVDLADIPQLEKNEAVAYRVFVNDKVVPETGMRLGEGNYVLLPRTGIAPMLSGAGYLAFPDSFRVGVKYKDFGDENTGEIYVDKEERNAKEKIVRTFSNKMGGNLAGIEYGLDYLADNGYKVLFLNPIVGGDNKSSHHYWNKNNFQISDDMGNIENYSSFVRKLFKKGMVYVNDGTFTSEGLEGINFSYALRWAGKDPSAYYYFKMQGIDNEPVGLGVIPKNDKNLRHIIINSPVLYDEETGKIKENPKYKSNKETYIQVYDASLVKEESLKDLERPFEAYDNIELQNPLSINTHNDTIINYAFEINPEEYVDRLQALTRFNKGKSEKIKLNSPEGTKFIGQFSNFRLADKDVTGVENWDANSDLNKMSYQVSGYDEKNELAKVDSSAIDYATEMRRRGAYAVQDMTLQAVRYWTKKVSDVQMLYIAQVLKDAKTEDEIAEKIKSGLLPKEVALTPEAVSNVLNGFYNLKPKANMDKDSTTIKALMSLPMTALEFGENTVGVLSSPYFSNRAISEEALGLTRFELLQKEDQDIVEPYAQNYMKTNLLFTHDIKNFADEIISKVDKSSQEKLLDEHGGYTEYGEYVIELVGQSIAKYAFLKALVGKELKTKMLPDGEITYDYRDIKDRTTLKSLGVNAANPKDEAEQLLRLFEKGIAKLEKTDVDFLAESISKQIDGTDLASFALAEAMISKSGLGIYWRGDAIKDLMAQDAIRTRDNSHKDVWNRLNNFVKKMTETIKAENPSSYFVAELTDLDQVLKANFGEQINAYDEESVINSKYKNVQAVLAKFFNETGVTSEAAYSYFFTDLINNLGKDFTSGAVSGGNLKGNIEKLVSTKSLDYIRNLMTFVGNHDKPRILHGFALDMGLFHGSLDIEDASYSNVEDIRKSRFLNGANANFDKNRYNRIDTMLQLTNSDSYQDLPLEAKLNLDNMDYFKTVSTKAVAMSKLLRDSINDTMVDDADKNLIKYLKIALVNLTNGNHLGIGSNTQIKSINIAELESVENALTEMLSLAGLELSEQEINDIASIAKNDDLISKYRIQGDFDWEGISSTGQDGVECLATKNKNVVNGILQDADESTENVDYKKYSLYAIAIAGILGEAFEQVKGYDNNAKEKFLRAKKDFIEKYNREFIENNRTKLPHKEDSFISRAKDGYASMDIKKALEILMDEAEYLAHNDGILAKNEHFEGREENILKIWQYSVEPARVKSVMAMSALTAMMGIPVIYGGDELAMSGYEEKAKNPKLKNRNPLPVSETEEGVYKDYRNRSQAEMNATMRIRSRMGLEALNNGTPYLMDTLRNEIPAILSQNAEGDMVISVVNLMGVSKESRFNYHDLYKITKDNVKQKCNELGVESINIDNPYVPILPRQELEYILLPEGVSLPDGLEFWNAGSADNAKYVVGKVPETGKQAIFREASKIILDGKTTLNGVFMLKHNPQKIVKNVARTIAHKGHSKNINKQYNIVSNPYKMQEKTILGEKLSLLSV